MVKKLSILLSMVVASYSFAQTSAEKGMETQIAKLESAKKSEDFQQSKDYFMKYVNTLSRGTETKKKTGEPIITLLYHW
jgi:hypothetical protein